MFDQCPLVPGRQVSDIEIPSICERQCGDLLTRQTTGDYDLMHEDGTDDCDFAETEDLGGDLTRLNEGDLRHYGSADACVGCGNQLGAQYYTFRCRGTGQMVLDIYN